MEKLGNTKLKALDKIFWSDKRQIIFFKSTIPRSEKGLASSTL